MDKLQRGVAAPPPVPRLTVTTLPMFPPDSPAPAPAPAPTKDFVGVLSMLKNIFYKLYYKIFFLIQEVERVRVGEVVNDNPIHQSFAKAKDVEDLYRLADYWLSPSR